MLFLPDDTFRVEFEQDETNGYIDSMKLKPSATFDNAQLLLTIHPIECFAGT